MGFIVSLSLGPAEVDAASRFHSGAAQSINTLLKGIWQLGHDALFRDPDDFQGGGGTTTYLLLCETSVTKFSTN